MLTKHNAYRVMHSPLEQHRFCKSCLPATLFVTHILTTKKQCIFCQNPSKKNNQWTPVTPKFVKINLHDHKPSRRSLTTSILVCTSKSKTLCGFPVYIWPIKKIHRSRTASGSERQRKWAGLPTLPALAASWGSAWASGILILCVFSSAKKLPFGHRNKIMETTI